MMMFLNLIDTDEEKSEFVRLYDKYDDLLMYVAMQKLNDFHLSEEAIQDTWLYIAKNFNKIIKVDSVHTKNYLCTIANGFAISKYRKESKVVNIDLELDYNTDDGTYDSLFNSFDTIDLKIALDKLDDESKNLLCLTYIYGYNSTELSKMFDAKPVTIRKKIQLAKTKIKKILECKEKNYE